MMVFEFAGDPNAAIARAVTALLFTADVRCFFARFLLSQNPDDLFFLNCSPYCPSPRR